MQIVPSLENYPGKLPGIVILVLIALLVKLKLRFEFDSHVFVSICPMVLITSQNLRVGLASLHMELVSSAKLKTALGE